MTTRLLLAVLAGGLLAGTAGAQTVTPPPPPDLSQSAIDGASLADYEARLKAREEAAKAAEDAAQPSDDASDTEGMSQPEPEAGDVAPADAQAAAEEKPEDVPDPFLIRLQVLLDHAHASPGVIDGLDGGNTAKAIRAFETMRDLPVDGKPDEAVWTALTADTGPATQRYAITEDDLKQRFVPDLPSDYAKLAELDWLGFRDVPEMLAERFHMDEDLLRRLNPDADFAKAGTELLVTVPGTEPAEKVTRIVVDKDKGELLAYGEDKALVLVFPATVGSSDNPSPSGRMKVNSVHPDPDYSYDPKKNFQQGDNTKKLLLPPGPNGPVGAMWIDLSKPTYGIHGTPEPAKIDKTGSHGCVRLTNWDAQTLAKLVLPGETTVEFKG